MTKDHLGKRSAQAFAQTALAYSGSGLCHLRYLVLVQRCHGRVKR